MQPEVSVVIPTFRRESRLSFALEALAAQSLDPSRFEVIVVRAEAGLDAERARVPAGLVAVELVSPVAGAAAQRNAGWRHARSELIAFLDDDCRPDEHWLAAILAVPPRADEFTQGRTEPDPDETHLLHGLARTMVVTEPSPWYPTCNIVYPQALLARTGGFDEAFPGAYGEDTDLAMKAIAAGARPRFQPGIRVYHAVHPRGLRGALREALRRDVMPMVVKRHSRVRQGLYHGLFFTWRHGYMWLAIAGALGGRAWRPMRLAIVPYLWRNVDRRRLGPRGVVSQAFHLPARALIDVAEVLVVLRAAIRHRVMVL